MRRFLLFVKRLAGYMALVLLGAAFGRLETRYLPIAFRRQ